LAAAEPRAQETLAPVLDFVKPVVPAAHICKFVDWHAVHVIAPKNADKYALKAWVRHGRIRDLEDQLRADAHCVR